MIEFTNHYCNGESILKRKLLKFISAVSALLIALQPLGAFSQNADISIEEDDEFNVTAALSFAETAYGIYLEARYDTDYLEFVSADKDGNDIGGCVKISFTESGALSSAITLRFKAKKGGATTVDFREMYYAGVGGYDIALEDITVPVNITPIVMGDADNNKIVAIRDLIRLKKYVSGIACDINLKASDLNGDGAVNADDLVRLKQLLIG